MADGIMIVVKAVLANPLACVFLAYGVYCKYFKRKAY